MTVTDYATVKGLNKSTVSRLAAKGMPLTSEQAADAWRARNAPPRNVKRPIKHDNDNKPTPKISLGIQARQEPSPRSTDPGKDVPPGNETAGKEVPDNLADALEDAKRAERGAKEALEQAQAGGTAMDRDRANKTFIQAQRHRAWMAKEYRAWQHENGITLYIDEAKRIYGQSMQAIMRLINTMPKAVSPRINDPGAEAVITDYCNKIRRTVQRELTNAEGVAI
jgi:hypothetical protein